MNLDRYEELVRRLATATRSTSLYSGTHPLVQRGTAAFVRSCGELLDEAPTLAIGFLGKEVVVNDTRLPRSAAQLNPFAAALQERSIERITVQRGANSEDLRSLIETLAGASSGPEVTAELAARGVRHVTIGMINVGDDRPRDAAAARRLYNSALEMAGTLWESARADGVPDPKSARALVSSLSRAMVEDRTSLLALTAVKKYDSYTFTHMVNVSVLTMSLARSLQIDSTMVADFGVAALMHDIGKTRTPPEILNKPDRLTTTEFEVMKRHVVDGAYILRRLPEMPPLAALVAFEHHVRLDGTGYPQRLSPRPQGLCSMIVSIADVFDALRSTRPYRESLASARVRALLTEDQRRMFHPTLLKRFVGLLGLYPVGQLVRLNTEEIGVVTCENPRDPFRPQVKVVRDRASAWLTAPLMVNTWERDDRGGYVRDIIEAVDPDVIGIDPLTLL